MTTHSESSFGQEKQVLEQYIAQHLPHAHKSGVLLESISTETLEMSVPLSGNDNEMGQAFGTGIYTACHMACWSALYLRCKDVIQKPRILTRDAQIRYRHPVTSDRVKASCRLPNDTQWKGFFAHYKNTGKTTLTLTSRVFAGNEIAVYFDGVFVLVDENTQLS